MVPALLSARADDAHGERRSVGRAGARRGPPTVRRAAARRRGHRDAAAGSGESRHAPGHRAGGAAGADPRGRGRAVLEPPGPRRGPGRPDGPARLAGRLFVDLRDKRGLAYTAASYYDPVRDLGALILYLGTAPENATKAEEQLRREIERIRTEPVGDDELRRAKGYLLGRYTMDR